jgi:hypothetical protein
MIAHRCPVGMNLLPRAGHQISRGDNQPLGALSMALQIGFPHDPVKLAKTKEKTLNDLLSSRARAWHSYFATMALAYEAAHKQHEATLTEIKQGILHKLEVLKLVFFTIIPTMVGGGMGNLVSNAGKTIGPRLLDVSKKSRAILVDFGVGAAGTVTKDVVKGQVAKALEGLVPEPGSEWNGVGATPFAFFVQLGRMVDKYTTDVTYSVELAKRTAHSDDDLHNYIDLLNSHLLSPFIQNAPMDTDRLYTEFDLAPIYEIFLWVFWARNRDFKYWIKEITLASEPHDRGLIGAVWDGITLDDDALEWGRAKDAVIQLDPILERLRLCGINQVEVTQAAGWDSSRRILNISWVRYLGNKHPNCLLSDLISNLDVKAPTSAFDDRPVDKSRRLK